MSTTSLKLSHALAQRAASAAKESGAAPQALMVDAIRQATEAVVLRSEFLAQALSARAEMLESGLVYDEQDVRSYLRKRVSDPQIEAPKMRFQFKRERT